MEILGDCPRVTQDPPSQLPQPFGSQLDSKTVADECASIRL